MAKLTPYISYDNAKEAIEYYEKYFMAKNSFRVPVSPEMAENMNITDIENTTMHGGFLIHDNLILCSDKMKYQDEELSKRMYLIIDYNNEDSNDIKQMEELYSSMINADGAKIEIELSEQFWGGKVAQVIDKYGILWMLHSQDYSKLQ